ncbi:uncharacterized protein LOC117178116 [Belonocnema kinseyi]|uniref:uncharacterized protein LOC117178116 n=1 Tax=Belonocnema kinseyi TaxID=2817044 RepID=UPI00143D6D8B|nr:uncharacterized protein LOC117178116 [Belonocnema kinseyi]
MAGVLVSPSAHVKSKTIEAANKIRHGSPKLHEVLRQRCRERMRERRGQLFNRRRFGNSQPEEDVQKTLTNIVRKEFNDLTSIDWRTNLEAFHSAFDNPLEVEEALELEAEILAEEEQWIFEEYCKDLQCEEEHMEEEVVFCPACQKNALEELPGFIFCSYCNLKLPAQISLANFKSRIEASANFHSSQCIRKPEFTVFSFNNNIALYLACQACSSFSPVFGDGPL